MSKIIIAEEKSNHDEELKLGYIRFAPQTDNIIDADAKQADALEVKPKPQPEVIVA